MDYDAANSGYVSATRLLLVSYSAFCFNNASLASPELGAFCLGILGRREKSNHFSFIFAFPFLL
jgi:hypothetical protein